MKTKFKILRFWIGANYNQIFMIAFSVYFFGQLLRLIF